MILKINKINMQIDYGTLIALSDACSAPYLSLVLYWATIAWRFMSYSDPSSCLIGFVFLIIKQTIPQSDMPYI